jgi:EmrB/QacA subfamily drug resistance transporter
VNPSPAVPPQQKRKVLLVICFGAFLVFNSFGSINVALPTLQAQFGSSLAEIQWISIIGVVMISCLSFCFGRAGDILGRVKFYRLGIAVYALGAGLCSLSRSFPELLIFRGIMSIGLAMSNPLSAAILASAYPAERRGWALGWYASAVAVGRAMGPTLGGFLLYLWGWQAIFLANFMIGLAVSVATFAVLDGEEELRKEPFDIWGAVFLIVGYPALLIALTLGAHSGWSSPGILPGFILAGGGLITFVWVELHTPKPLIDISLFRRRSLTAALLSVAVSYAVHSPINIFAPLYMQNVLHYSPLALGLVMASLPAFTALSSPLSGRLADRFEARGIATLGLIFIFLGISFYSGLRTDSTTVSVVVALLLVGIGTGFFMPANQKAAFSSVGHEQYGILSAMLTSFGTATGTLGTTITVALIAGIIAGKQTPDPAEFAAAQHFAFSALVPLAAVGVLISLAGRPKKPAGGGRV